MYLHGCWPRKRKRSIGILHIGPLLAYVTNVLKPSAKITDILYALASN